MPHSINGGLMSLRFCMAVLVVAVRLAYGQVSALGISPAALNFGSQPIGTSSGAQSVVFTNNGTAPLTISAMVLTGIFYNDFSLPSQNICVATLAPGGSCTLAVTFTPGGTSTRTASLSVMGNFASPQTVSLTGNGLGTCVNVTNCAFQLINQRVDANQNAFFVYEDGNSAFNHGYISLFGTVDLTKVGINAFCVDDPALQTGCSSDAAALDGVRGTVVSFTYPPMAGENYVGLDFLDPENYNGTTVTGNAYNLTPGHGNSVRSPFAKPKPRRGPVRRWRMRVRLLPSDAALEPNYHPTRYLVPAAWLCPILLSSGFDRDKCTFQRRHRCRDVSLGWNGSFGQYSVYASTCTSNRECDGSGRQC